MKILLTLCLFSLANLSFADSDQSLEELLRFSETDIPSAPDGIQIMIFGPIFLKQFEKARGNKSWKGFLTANGVTFPEKGFTKYFSPGRTLIVATTPDQKDFLYTLLAPILEPPEK